MNSELVGYVQNATGYSEPTVANVLKSAFNFIQLSVRQGKECKINSFGTFSSKDIPERIGRNPRTGEQITIPPKRRPIFKFSKVFIQAIQQDSLASSEITELHRSQPTPQQTTSEKKLPPPVPLNLLQPRNWYMNTEAGTIEVAETELISKGCSTNTPLWSLSTGWRLAKDIPELNYLFNKSA